MSCFICLYYFDWDFSYKINLIKDSLQASLIALFLSRVPSLRIFAAFGLAIASKA